jgi:hypothetical protein
MSFHLIEDATLLYIPANGLPVTRRVRVWEETGTLKRRCVVTERPEDEGTSITNAAEEVADSVAMHWGADCQIIEHYTGYGPSDPEHFDEVVAGTRGRPTWRRLDKTVLAKELPGLLSSSAAITEHEGAEDDQ